MVLTISAPPNSLLSMLGFVDGQTTDMIVNASKLYTFPFDKYINITVEDFTPTTFYPYRSSFKIPINPQINNTIYWSQNSYNKQIVENKNKSQPFQNFNIKVTDAYGNILNNNGIDWSITFDLYNTH